MEIGVWTVGNTVEDALDGECYFSEDEATTAAEEAGLHVFWAVTTLYPDDFARV